MLRFFKRSYRYTFCRTFIYLNSVKRPPVSHGSSNFCQTWIVQVESSLAAGTVQVSCVCLWPTWCNIKSSFSPRQEQNTQSRYRWLTLWVSGIPQTIALFHVYNCCTVYSRSVVYNAYDPRGVNAVPQSTRTKAVLLVHVGYNTNRLTTVELSSIFNPR